MLFLRTLRYSPRWFGLYKLPKTMVDYQVNLDWWLQDATLFQPSEPIENGILDFNGLAGQPLGKAGGGLEPDQDILGLDLDWLDEKIDFSIFDTPNVLPDPLNDAEMLMAPEDPQNILDELMGGFDPSCLPSDVIDTPKSGNLPFVNVATTQAAVPSPESSIEAPASPISSMASPVSSAPLSPSSSLCSPVSAADTASDSSVSPVYVTICNIAPELQQPHKQPLKLETINIEDISDTTKKRKYAKKANRAATVHPYNSGAPTKRQSRYERKKVQNKEAAARYRIKKRVEEQGLSDEVSTLELQQKNLKEKHDQLENEIKYLKSLLKEMFHARGILK